jgi:hypothetical protein
MTQVRGSTTQGDLYVANFQGITEHYQLKLLTTKGKVTKVTSWPITLDNGKTWDKKIAYTAFMGAPTVTANLYLLPDTTTVYRHADNGESTK